LLSINCGLFLSACERHDGVAESSYRQLSP
jgi:hypothetical protein